MVTERLRKGSSRNVNCSPPLLIRTPIYFRVTDWQDILGNFSKQAHPFFEIFPESIQTKIDIQVSSPFADFKPAISTETNEWHVKYTFIRFGIQPNTCQTLMLQQETCRYKCWGFNLRTSNLKPQNLGLYAWFFKDLILPQQTNQNLELYDIKFYIQTSYLFGFLFYLWSIKVLVNNKNIPVSLTGKHTRLLSQVHFKNTQLHFKNTQISLTGPQNRFYSTSYPKRTPVNLTGLGKNWFYSKSYLKSTQFSLTGPKNWFYSKVQICPYMVSKLYNAKYSSNFLRSIYSYPRSIL